MEALVKLFVSRRSCIKDKPKDINENQDASFNEHQMTVALLQQPTLCNTCLVQSCSFLIINIIALMSVYR